MIRYSNPFERPEFVDTCSFIVPSFSGFDFDSYNTLLDIDQDHSISKTYEIETNSEGLVSDEQGILQFNEETRKNLSKLGWKRVLFFLIKFG
jgi:hypothetical protein